MKYPWHRWKNLKNNEDNHKNMRSLFATLWDEAIVIVLAIAVIAIWIDIITGV